MPVNKTMPQIVREELFALRDEQYRLFQAGLMPDVPLERIIGVRTPLLRRLAKDYAKREGIEAFLDDLPHAYYDENNLHGFLISGIRDFKETTERVDALLPFVDNWATCDLLSPASFRKNKALLLPEIDRWLASERTFTVRFGIEMLLSHFLDGDFDPSVLEKAVSVKTGEYYVDMMVAWFFATALAKQWEASLPYLEQDRMPVWIHNKTIQKARESRRIPQDRKELLAEMRRQ